MFPHYRLSEDFFGDSIALTTDVWTLRMNFYIMGERPLFEVFVSVSDDIIIKMVSTVGRPPERQKNKWRKRLACWPRSQKGGRRIR
jgi:hypothetical protein